MLRLPSELQIGDVVAGKYRLVKEIGSGAMGVVVAAHHLNLDRTVAIKFLVGDALTPPDAVARFVREARAAARIRSRHVVRVHDVAVLPSGVPFIELEYLEGCDLAARLMQLGRLPVPQAVDFVLQACDAIAEAHGLGIIHRDLKPANLFVVLGSGEVETLKVLDFGISKTPGSVSSTLSAADCQPGAVSTAPGPIGSPCYMSPEQMRSARDVDPRTDVWALGVTLFELATGELPFPGQSLVELYAMINSGAPLGLRRRFPDLPEALEAAILKCLEVDRERRFPTVDALATMLLPLAPNREESYVRRLAASPRHVFRIPEVVEASIAEPKVPSNARATPMTQTRASAAPIVGHRSPARATLGMWSAGLVSLLGLGGAAAGLVFLPSRSTLPQPVAAARIEPSRVAVCGPEAQGTSGECAATSPAPTGAMASAHDVPSAAVMSVAESRPTSVELSDGELPRPSLEGSVSDARLSGPPAARHIVQRTGQSDLPVSTPLERPASAAPAPADRPAAKEAPAAPSSSDVAPSVSAAVVDSSLKRILEKRE